MTPFKRGIASIKRLFHIFIFVVGFFLMFTSFKQKPKDVPKIPVVNTTVFGDNTSFKQKAKDVPKIPVVNTTVFGDKACIQPELTPFSVDYLRHFKTVQPIHCSSDEDWLEVLNGTIFVTNAAKRQHGSNISCQIKFAVRKDDLSTTYKDSVTLLADKPLKMSNEFFKAKCLSASGKQYRNIHTGIPFYPNIHERKANTSSGLGLDILMLGFDSVSHMTYLRKLKKTYSYLMNTLDGIVLNGYNIVGDGTGHALTPILTGKTEVELPSTLKTVPNTEYVNVWPFIWKDLRKHGYVTTYAEDCPNIHTYNYRLRGFKEQPTDHYIRNFYLAATPQFKNHKRLCLGSKRRSEVFLNYMKDFYTMYRKKHRFAFGFHNELSHDDANLVETADEDLKSTIKFLYDGGYLNNTMLILMSDHGARFSSMRRTLQGKMEERLPFFAFHFPAWFRKKNPILINNLIKNTNRLVTPFDIHETLRDMIDFNGSGLGNVKERGISLFKEIPLSRTCAHASIGTHWCTCLKWKSIDLSDQRVLKVAEETVNQINNITSEQRQKCVELKLKKILTAQLYSPESDLLKFKNTIRNGVYDTSDNTKVDNEVVQVSLEVEPSGGVFEATASLIKTKVHITNDISRTNKYGQQSACIEKDFPHLKKYCYCSH